MPAWQWGLHVMGALLLVVLLYAVALVVRRRWIARAGGTFELSYRARSERAGRGWVLGMGRYSGDVLEFFRIFSVVPAPMARLCRSDLGYEGQREPEGAETHSLYADHVIIRCRTRQGPVELAMSPDALTGFLAWLEAAPPGHRAGSY